MSETLEIGSVKPRIRYEGDGTTTEFSFAFKELPPQSPYP